MVTRRSLLLGAPAVACFGAVNWTEEMQSGDVRIRIMNADESKDGPFLVGVRTPVRADHAFVEVFYHAHAPGIKEQLLLHQESLGVIAGNSGYGATNNNFTMPRDSVQWIQVTLMRDLVTREFGRT